MNELTKRKIKAQIRANRVEKICENISEKKMNSNDLIMAVLRWWDKHECDMYVIDGEDYNVYKTVPEFVRIAKELKIKED